MKKNLFGKLYIVQYEGKLSSWVLKHLWVGGSIIWKLCFSKTDAKNEKRRGWDKTEMSHQCTL